MRYHYVLQITLLNNNRTVTSLFTQNI